MAPLLARLGLGSPPRSRGRNAGVESLPLYSPVAASESSTYRRSESEADPADGDDGGEDDDRLLYLAQRLARARARESKTAAAGPLDRPKPTRFVADFTLGFADGLTVPFALTAGLSSLGQTDTVIYAGMAEICAGSISMGIGGYLSAKGERKAAAVAAATGNGNGNGVGDTGDSDDWDDCTREDPEKEATARRETAVARYLDPLGLPSHLAEMVLEHVRVRPEIRQALLLARASRDDGRDDDDDDARLASSPVLVGLSVSLGYLLGGLLPLFPYFFVTSVDDGLLWSFAVCVVALFVFGFAKDFALSRRDDWGDGGLRRGRGRRRIPWGDVGRSAWEGMQMVILGSVAALAAVLCVRLFEGFSVASPEAGS